MPGDSTMLLEAKTILRRLQKHGFSAHIVGGFVRDIMLDQRSSDIDIATSARGEQILQIFPGSLLVGKAYGIALVNGFEVAPYRRDLSCDGRNAEVEFVDTIEEDLSRRDFTINAMALAPDGTIIAPHGGIDDINNKILRFVGNPEARLTEDYTRGLRALRLSAQLGFDIEEATYAAIVANATRIAAEPPERIMKEFTKAKVNFGKFIELLFSTGIGDLVFKAVGATRGVPHNPEWHPEGGVFEHTMKVCASVPDHSCLEVRLAALYHDVGKAVTTEVKDGKIISHGHDDAGAPLALEELLSLKCSKDLAEEVSALVKEHMLLHGEVTKKAIRRRVVNYGKEFVVKLLAVTAADCMGEVPKVTAKNITLTKEVLEGASEAAISSNLEAVLSGSEIMEAFNLKPGKKVGELKKALLDHQLGCEEEVTKTAALTFLKGFVASCQ